MKIAILGAEGTGKTRLAQALCQSLQVHVSTSLVPEFLREWCVLHERTPRPEDQRAIAEEQARRVQMEPSCGFLISDTTALMTAVYSDVLFQDASLYPFALEQQRRFDLTLLTGLDLAWEADGIQRDGPHSQLPIDARLRQVLQAQGLPYAVVYGTGIHRTEAALQAIFQHQRTPVPQAEQTWQWNCEKCSDAACEHRLFSRLLQEKSVRV